MYTFIFIKLLCDNDDATERYYQLISLGVKMIYINIRIKIPILKKESIFQGREAFTIIQISYLGKCFKE